MRVVKGLILAGLIAAAPVDAQIARAGWIDAAAAARITDGCLALAARSGWKVHVAVLNGHGDLVRFVGMDGASRASSVFAIEKARTVFRTGRSTRDVAKMDPSSQRLFEAVALTGGVPVMAGERLVGTVGVSGTRPDDDEACALAGIAAAM